MLITNDGELTHRLLSPAYHVKKTYFVQVDQKIPDTTAGQFAEGVDIGDEKRTLPADLKILGDREAELTISEGRFHQVKRMFASVGCKVTYLKRISMGTLTLGTLEKATYRKLTEQELASLKKKRKINNHQEYKIMYEGYLPISKQDMQERGIKQLDFVYVCGDAYVDHPSFGHAIIARLLEAHGYTVGIIAQPDWKDDASISVLGVPRLGFLVSAGNMDSMVNHYSVSKNAVQLIPIPREA